MNKRYSKQLLLLCLITGVLLFALFAKWALIGNNALKFLVLYSIFSVGCFCLNLIRKK